MKLNMQIAALNSAHSLPFQGIFGNQVDQELYSRGYRLGRAIGEGSYCKVRQAFRKTRGRIERCACKEIDRRMASPDFVSRFLPRELAVLHQVRHPHIVRIMDIIEIGPRVYVFMELCELGDLLEHVRVRGEPLPELRAKLYFRQLLSAVEYLHSLDISHRDLKCENVLLSSRDCVKLADFGFASRCTDDNGRRVLSQTFCGSAAYAAPEIIMGTPYNPKMYDVWSLGVILYVMLTASMPFDDSDAKSMLEAQTLRRLRFPRRNNYPLSQAATRLVMHLLEPDVTQRATIRQVKKCVWLRSEV